MTDPRPFGPVLHRARNVRRIDPPTIIRRLPANDAKPVDEWAKYLARMDKNNLDPAGDVRWIYAGLIAGLAAVAWLLS